MDKQNCFPPKKKIFSFALTINGKVTILSQLQLLKLWWIVDTSVITANFWGQWMKNWRGFFLPIATKQTIPLTYKIEFQPMKI